MKTLVLSLVTLSFTMLVTPVSAAQNCLPVNGGGPTDQKVCVTAAPSQNPASATKPLPQRTAGGQTIYPATNNKSTPSTGPESTSYAILISMAGVGVYLLKKSNKASI